jgi:serine/threonine protein kinase
MRSGDQFGDWAPSEEIGRGYNSKVSGRSGTAKRRTSERYQRFVREIGAMRELTADSGVMELIEAEIPAGEGKGEYPWYVMPEGVPLDRLLREASLEEIVQALQSIAATLSRLHQRGFAHRDVKPQNLFAMGDGYVLGDPNPGGRGPPLRLGAGGVPRHIHLSSLYRPIRSSAVKRAWRWSGCERGGEKEWYLWSN